MGVSTAKHTLANEYKFSLSLSLSSQLESAFREGANDTFRDFNDTVDTWNTFQRDVS